MKIKFEINGHPIETNENPKKKLSEYLKQNNYFSIKNGCNQGKCGSCTVLLNNNPVLSCLIPLAEIEQTQITTLEGFMKSDEYVDIEKAFKQKNINFCGYCNAGKIFITYKIIKHNPFITREEIKKEVSFLKCNCVELDSFANGIYLACAIRRNRIKDKLHAK